MKPRSSLTLVSIRADMMDVSPIPAMLPASKTDKAPPEPHSPELPVSLTIFACPWGSPFVLARSDGTNLPLEILDLLLGLAVLL